MSTTDLKTVDSKGRLNLGKAFTGRQVRVTPTSDGAHVQFVEVVPAPEAWLWENKEALERVRRGVEDAAAGHLVAPPDGLDAALASADTPDDE